MFVPFLCFLVMLGVSLRTLAVDPSSPKGTSLSPEKILLWPGDAPVGDGTREKTDANITVYRPAEPNGTAMVICPGGGYGGLVTGPEGSGIAQWLNAQGVVGVVLQYRLPKGRPFVPLLDAQRAIRIVRSHAKEWACNEQRIGIIGFSAGGHLASSAATLFDSPESQAAAGGDRVNSRPDFAILIYPVISMMDHAHGGSKQNLLGSAPEANLLKRFSTQMQVTSQTPPTFLAHAVDDHAVSPENSRLFYNALQAHHVAARYLELPSGDHGLNGYQGPMWDAWQSGSLEWLQQSGFLPKKAVRQ